MRAASLVALLVLVASATSREELSAEKAVEVAAPPSVCGEQCQNKYDVKVRVYILSQLSSLVLDAAHLCSQSSLVITELFIFIAISDLELHCKTIFII